MREALMAVVGCLPSQDNGADPAAGEAWASVRVSSTPDSRRALCWKHLHIHPIPS